MIILLRSLRTDQSITENFILNVGAVGNLNRIYLGITLNAIKLLLKLVYGFSRNIANHSMYPGLSIIRKYFRTICSKRNEEATYPVETVIVLKTFTNNAIMINYNILNWI